MFRKRPESRIPAKDLNQIKPNPLSYGIPDGFDFDEYRNQSKSFQKKADLITILIKLAIISILLCFSILVFEIVTGYNSKFIVFSVPFIGLSLLVWFGMHNGIYSRLSKIIPKSGPLSYWNEMEAYTVSIEHWNYMHSETEEGYWLQKRGRDFEVAIADMLLRRGVDADLTPQTNDGGIDIIISIDKKNILLNVKPTLVLFRPLQLEKLREYVEIIMPILFYFV